MAMAEVNGVRLHFQQLSCERTEGDIEDVVLIHGLAANLAFWYMPIGHALAKHYRVTMYDLRGHGRSSMPEQGYTSAEQAEDLRQLLDFLGIERAHFIAHSFGGTIALNLACEQPQRFHSLTIADTHIAAIRNVGADWRYAEHIQHILDDNGIDLDTREPYFGYRLLKEAAALQLNQRELPEALRELINPLMGASGKRTADQWVRLLETTAAQNELMGDDGLEVARLRKLDFPLLAIYGERSQAVTTGELLLSVWPRADFRLVRNAGHFFPASRPQKLIRSFEFFLRSASNQRQQRAEDTESKPFFRSDRIYNRGQEWFYATREGKEQGPFVSFDDALDHLNAFIAEILARKVRAGSMFNLSSKIRVPAGLSEDDFHLIARNGFGDGINAYAHAMAWFNDHLYVGTTRGNFPLMKARLPISMDPWPVECPANPFDLDLHAEIWRYNPRRDEWKRVFKAPTIIGSDGSKIPRELGFRGMCVYPGSEGRKPSLFVSTWSPAKGPGPLLLRSEDGLNFTPSCEPGLMGLPVTTIRTMVSFKGRMYTTPAGSRGGNPNVSSHSIVYESERPEEGKWEPVSDFGFGDDGNKTIFEMCPFGDHLYVGTFNLKGYQVWRSTCETKPYHWEPVVVDGAGRGPLNQSVLSMYPFKGALYVGSAIQGGGIDRQNGVGPAPPELIRIRPDKSWDLLVGDARQTVDGWKEPLSGYMAGFDNFFNGYFWRMAEHEGWLYLSTFDWSGLLGYARRDSWPEPFLNIVNSVGEHFIFERQSGFDLYRSYDGENWVPVTTNGMGNPYNIGMRTIVSSPYGLFLGAANPFGPRVWPLGGDRYIDNPRGGCEVFFAPRKQMTSAAPSAGIRDRSKGSPVL